MRFKCGYDGKSNWFGCRWNPSIGSEQGTFVKGMDDVKNGNDTVAASFTNMIMPLIDSLKNLYGNIFVDLNKSCITSWYGELLNSINIDSS